jgi:hypothetical protein
MTTTDVPTDVAKRAAFVGQVVSIRAQPSPGRCRHRLGLYKAMAGVGPATSATPAQRTGTTMQISGSLFVTTDYGLPVKPD